MNQQLLALLYAVLGGISMGIYPAFIKTPAVLEAQGWLFLLPRWHQVAHSDDPNQQLYVFSYWGILSAVAWVPSGISTIFAVPRVGMGMTTAVSSATASFLSFMVFWLVFDSKMKSYPCGPGCKYYRAPIYLAATVIGMFMMIFVKDVAIKLKIDARPSLLEEPIKSNSLNFSHRAGDLTEPIKSNSLNSPANWFAGICVAISSGTFGAIQYAVVNIGKHIEQQNSGCRDDPKECPLELKEQFNTLGSWMVSFGLGALAMAAFVLSMVSVRPTGAGIAGVPNFHIKVLGPPGCAGILAGTFWAIGNFLCTTGVEIGGNAVVMAQSLSATIITSGLLGIFYYDEGGSFGTKCLWFVSALWTLAAMILLGLEKVQAPGAAEHGSGSTDGTF